MTNNAPTPSIESTSLDSLAPIFKASGDPLRLEILRVLRRDTFGVMELSQLFDMRQSGMSHHLKVMNKAGLLEPQREGNAIFYRRPLNLDSDKLADQTIRQIFDMVDQVPMPEHLQDRIEAIRLQRANQSQAFFSRHAAQFREQQELIAAFELYAEPTAELIRQRASRQGWHTALEIGPGEGGFLNVLAALCEQVVALDNSRDMLAKATRTCIDERLNNVDLIEGVTDTLLARGDAFDLVVANMVLHHVPSPADIFLDAAALMNNGGCFVVSDLCSHDQDWAKENCGDLWLGFEPEELTAWADDAGLVSGESLFIGLRNGFQVQVREFWKSIGSS
ncbi:MULTISPECIES: metalloregulator ArsR/SmtB family transcription factor [Marinobacter]|uniref:metalloregulator ArsR/SmtB family transcription factor n=1 Tax=Marinobacter TaxID=2742 RepID=UPI001D0657D7|nr:MULTISPECIES: metalloregulator ArsR/SmtB family transcription factor [Marinobacter]MCG8519885.1 metalloregulator ArsR/SmtB family transcription factor [Pseudomonadales bacterium]MCK7565287.1 metalloregulator ArsR/SmtB family transcription factor [Marinobacter xestospongiae]UDL06063.1 metalloregulator ArsR/SmtB family transcription factor [Marinobacter sp. CA1]